MRSFFLALCLFIAGSMPGQNYIADSTEIFEEFTDNTQPVGLRKLDHKKWENLSKNIDYTQKEKENDRGWNYQLPSLGFISPLTAQIIFFSLIFLLLGGLLYFLVRNGIFNLKTKIDPVESYHINDLEERINEADLEGLLQKALTNKEYKQAIRIFYLIGIKTLSEKTLINWKKQKTNYEYLLEVRDKPFYALFSRITLYYEWIWYGDKNIDELEYNKEAINFKRFVEEIKK